MNEVCAALRFLSGLRFQLSYGERSCPPAPKTWQTGLRQAFLYWVAHPAELKLRTNNGTLPCGTTSPPTQHHISVSWEALQCAAILICLAVLFLSEPMLAQQRRQPAPVPRTFVAKEPLPCVAFNSMAARLDAVYRIEDISQSEYDEGLKKYIAGTQADGVDYFASERKQISKNDSAVGQAR